MAIDADAVAAQLPRSAARLADQLRRASDGVCANVAEGSGAGTTPEFLRYLRIARASLRETESHVERIRGHHATSRALASLDLRLVHTGRLLHALIQRLETRPK